MKSAPLRLAYSSDFPAANQLHPTRAPQKRRARHSPLVADIVREIEQLEAISPVHVEQVGRLVRRVIELLNNSGAYSGGRRRRETDDY